MKKCIHCGKEIPDEAEFCGFCGTRQPESENKTESETEKTEIIPTVENDNAGNEVKTESETAAVEETEKQEEEPSSKEPETAEVVNPEPVENTDSSSEENTSSEDSDIKDAEIVEPASEEKEDSVQPAKAEDADASEKEETVEEPSESEEPENPAPAENPETSEKEDSDEDHEVKDAETVEPSSEENEDSDSSEQEEKADDSSKEKTEEKHAEKKKPHFTMPKINLPKINVSGEDLNAVAQMIKNPEQRVGITNTLSWLILLFALIANWVAFGSFSSGFCTLVIVLIGLVLINWLTDKEHVSFTATVRNSAEIILAPSVLVLIGGLFIRNIRSGAEIYAFHSIFTTAFIGLFFLSAALILLIITVMRRYEMKIWHVVWILTIFLALLFWYLITSGMFALLS